MFASLRNTWRRLPLAAKSLTSLVPVFGGYYVYAIYVDRQTASLNLEQRIARYERDRDAVGRTKLSAAAEDSSVKCFLDIEIDDKPAGRLEILLYDTIVPRTVENFVALCENKCKPIYFEGGKPGVQARGYARDKARFFRVVPGSCAQAGMMPLQGNIANKSRGTGYKSVCASRLSR
jgi:hypothetical protein